MSTLVKKYMQTFELTCNSKGDSVYLLKIAISPDERGIIYKVTAVLFAHGWDIEEAVAETENGKFAKDVFVIRNLQGHKMTEQNLLQIKAELKSLFHEGAFVIDYLEKSGADINSYKKSCNFVVDVFNPPAIDSTVLDIRTLDRPGLLYKISEILYLSNIDIISFTAKSENKKIRDSFLLCSPGRERLTGDECSSLKQKFLEVFS